MKEYISILFISGKDLAARNPRARALKCRHFVHWRKAMAQFII